MADTLQFKAGAKAMGWRARFGGTPIVAAVAVLILAALPLVLNERYTGTLSKMLVASIFALAFNILWQQTRLLSFGHAAYFGIGMFAVIHLMRGVEAGVFYFPLPLVPLAGAFAALVFGWVVGYFATIRSGTYFAMITLAAAELIHQLAPQLERVFGGESGLSSMRMPWAGLTFASSIEVYYLVLVWFLLAVAAMRFFTTTPLGRLAFALGDNDQRVRFLGYDAHALKTRVFAISAMFSGLAGGLLAIANENADHTIFNAFMSAAPVIHTFVGGAGVFFGPVIGGAGLSLFGFIVSDVTRLWLLYLGVGFVLVVMYAPQGVGGVIVEHISGWRGGRVRSLILPYVVAFSAAGFLASGAIFLMEYLARLFSDPHGLQSVLDKGFPEVVLFGVAWPPASPLTWVVPFGLFAIGLLLLRVTIRRSAGVSNSAGSATPEH